MHVSGYSLLVLDNNVLHQNSSSPQRRKRLRSWGRSDHFDHLDGSPKDHAWAQQRDEVREEQLER